MNVRLELKALRTVIPPFFWVPGADVGGLRLTWIPDKVAPDGPAAGATA
jgi:hypothetical protein